MGIDSLLKLIIGFAFAAFMVFTLVEIGSTKPLQAQHTLDAVFSRGSETGLPLPRFVSLRPSKARMRIGPSTDYATRWIYQAPGLPLEITEEYGHWRHVRDYDGASGWMYSALLSGNRTGVIGPWLKKLVSLRVSASSQARAIAQLEPTVRLRLMQCDGQWCRVHLPADRLTGYIRQAAIWGAYPSDVFG